MATIRDVARMSNVSIATVSRVFNDSPVVSLATRERVIAAARSLGYWPNGIARSLITNRTHTLGVLLPELHGEFFSEVIHGVDLASRAQGFHLLVSRSSSRADELVSALRSMHGRVDGLAVMAPDMDASAALRQSADVVPTVLLNPDGALPGWDSVSIANFDGAYAAVRHLLGLGRRRVAIITGPSNNIDARQRLDGYRRACLDHRADPQPGLEIAGEFTEHSGYEAVRSLLSLAPRPDAVFVANDHMAVGVLGALHDAGVRVPDDMAIAGFDDIALVRYLSPPLTTVRVDMLELGRRAVDLLLERLGAPDGSPARHIVLPARLIVRSSCGASPKGRTEAGERWNRGDLSRTRPL
jgi:LacI family transcriptional regulator